MENENQRKLTIEEFRKIKSQLLSMYEQAEKEVSQDNRKNVILDIFNESYKLQEQLLMEDLSNIPFEEYEGIVFFQKLIDYKDGELIFLSLSDSSFKTGFLRFKISFNS